MDSDLAARYRFGLAACFTEGVVDEGYGTPEMPTPLHNSYLGSLLPVEGRRNRRLRAAGY